MTTALCLGGADCVREDWQAALELFQPDLVLACNHVGMIWPGQLDAWVSMHPEQLRDWQAARIENGHPDADEFFSISRAEPDLYSFTDHLFPGVEFSGSSGMMAAKVALCDLGADKVILAGVPLDDRGHFYNRRVLFTEAPSYRTAWQQVWPEHRARMRSMSGWTADFLGRPDKEWLTC